MKYLKKTASDNPYDESNRQQITNAILRLVDNNTANLNQLVILVKSNKINKIPVNVLQEILGAMRDLDQDMQELGKLNQWINR